MQRFGVVRLLRQDIPITGFGFAAAASLMMLHTSFQELNRARIVGCFPKRGTRTALTAIHAGMRFEKYLNIFELKQRNASKITQSSGPKS
jgi:hypothetical protein